MIVKFNLREKLLVHIIIISTTYSDTPYAKVPRNVPVEFNFATL